MSDSKSGFEIRADLLNQAQGLLEGNLSREVDSVYAHNDNHPDRKKDLPVRELSAGDVITPIADMKSINNKQLTSALIKAVQELNAKIDALGS